MNTNQEVTTGIVLKVVPYKENDNLLTVYTLDYGRITIHAKGVRKVNSKNASATSELTLSEFTFIPKKGISTLIKASSINYFRRIKEDLKEYVYATYFLEYILKVTKENDPDQDLYNLLKVSLEKMEQGIPYLLLYNKFSLAMLEGEGILLEADECAVCGSLNHIATISIPKLGFVCKNCMDLKDRILDKEVLRLFRHLVRVPIDKVEMVEYNALTIKEVTKYVEAFVDEYSGIYFQSKKFFK